MNPGEFAIDLDLVEFLVTSQFPQFADACIEQVRSAGTDNAMFRLGGDLVVRLPRIDWAVDSIYKEQRWLAYLEPRVSLAVPQIVEAGQPCERFEHPWSILRWIDGSDLGTEPADDPVSVATELGRFVRSLWAVGTADGPRGFRAGPLGGRNRQTGEAITQLAGLGLLDDAEARAFWDRVIAGPQHCGQPVWLHCDLLPGNLITSDAKLAAVIDFGGCGIGDRACDLMAGWTVFDGEARAVFRETTAATDQAWALARGWAFSFGLGAWSHYRVTNPTLAAIGQRAALGALADPW